jgi:hypothetical protein
MNRRLAGILAAILSLTVSVIGLLPVMWTHLPRPQGRQARPGLAGDDPCVPGSCTILAVRRGEKVFFGNYLYYRHQYGDVVTLDLAREMAKASRPTPLRDLFSRQTVEQAEKERREYSGQNH